MFPIVSLMHHTGLLTNKVLRKVSSFAEKLDTMTGDELLHFAVVYTSNEMGNCVDRAKRINALE